MYWQRLVFTGESRKLVLFVHSWWRQAVMWLTEASLHWWKLVLFVHSWWRQAAMCLTGATLHWWKQKAGSVCSQLMKTDSHVLTEASLHWWKQKAGSVSSQLMEDRQPCDWQRLVFTGESWFCLFTVDEDRQSCDWQRLVFTGESRKLVLLVHSWWKTDSHVLTEASLHWWKQKAGSVCSQLMKTGSHVTDRG